jgi:hypothetical protein
VDQHLKLNEKAPGDQGTYSAGRALTRSEQKESFYGRIERLVSLLSDEEAELDPAASEMRIIRELIDRRNRLMHIAEYPATYEVEGEVEVEESSIVVNVDSRGLNRNPWANSSIGFAGDAVRAVESIIDAVSKLFLDSTDARLPLRRKGPAG